MGEEFEDRDLSESVFWGVDLKGSMFRDVDVSNSTFFHTEWNDVNVDGVINRLVINGVDVTDHVNANDRWFPLRTQLTPSTADGVLMAWRSIESEWVALCDRMRSQPSLADASVDGEWSLRQTMRHLIFAMDKWFSFPLLGVETFTPCGLPNTGSQGLDWAGLDREADPSFDEVLGVCAAQSERFVNYLESADFATLPESVEVLENGSVPTLVCFHAVLEEEFEHLRYMIRDLGDHR